MTSNLPQKILVADNDQGVLNSISNGLTAYKITVITAKDWESALYQFNTNKLDLCLVSLEMEGIPGTALIQKWRQHESEGKRYVSCILSTAKQRVAGDGALIKELGDVGVILKPIQIPKLLSAMANALSMAHKRKAVIQVNEQIVSPLLKQQKFDKALVAAETKLEPIGEKGQFLSSQAHCEAKDYDRAQMLLKNLIQKDSNNMSYHNELARIFLQTGKMAEAQKCYEKADQAAPKNLDRIHEMAHMYLELKLPEKSMEKFRDLIKLNPEKPDMKFDVYQTIADAGFLTHAQEICKQTSTPRELVRHFNNKGVLMSKQEKYVDAIDEYQKAVRLIPGHKELHRILYNMALAHINLKSREHIVSAHDLLHQCLELQPGFDKAKEKLAITSKYVGKKDS